MIDIKEFLLQWFIHFFVEKLKGATTRAGKSADKTSGCAIISKTILNQ